jgi:hypothetical protein
LSALVDEPASADDIAFEYIGEDVVEAANATDSFDASLPTTYAADIVESVTAGSSEDATVSSGVTWNPADKSTAITLSNGNLSAQGTSPSGNIGARATSSRSSGQYYFEVKVTGTVQNCGPGIALAIADMTGNPNLFNVSLINVANGAVFVNSSTNQGTVVSFAVNDVCCVAVDLTNQKIHYRKNGGNWNNNATHNPATNTGGFNISFRSSNAVYPFADFSTSTLSILTANFGATAFTQAIPSGFSAWQ